MKHFHFASPTNFCQPGYVEYEPGDTGFVTLHLDTESYGGGFDRIGNDIWRRCTSRMVKLSDGLWRVSLTVGNY